MHFIYFCCCCRALHRFAQKCIRTCLISYSEGGQIDTAAVLFIPFEAFRRSESSGHPEGRAEDGGGYRLEVRDLCCLQLPESPLNRKLRPIQS